MRQIQSSVNSLRELGTRDLEFPRHRSAELEQQHETFGTVFRGIQSTSVDGVLESLCPPLSSARSTTRGNVSIQYCQWRIDRDSFDFS